MSHVTQHFRKFNVKLTNHQNQLCICEVIFIVLLYK